MLTTYSPASQVGKFLKERNLPQETFSQIVGVSTGQLSEFLSGKRPLPNALAEEWLQLIKTIKEFSERLDGIPINWHPRCSTILKKKLRDFEKRQLLISVVDLGPSSTVSDAVARAARDLAAAVATETKQD